MPISEEVKRQYRPTIGIETHVQLKTKTKLFSAVSNDARQAAPNSLISHIDAGLPGALPVLNEAAVELAVRAAYALNAVPQKFSKFDRKHYFYPDLPKGYQITQYENPIIVGGYVDFRLDGEARRVNIRRVHLEEDAGKNIHPPGAEYSLVDLNRAGTPLLEIVSEPDIHSAAEAKAYTRELYLLMKYSGVSDVDLYHGNMRFDINVSLSKEPDKPAKRAEIKNLNSFRSVENAVAYEIERQIGLYETGQVVEQETRGWDEAKQKTTSQRGKEEAHDYRYMPEPDIPPLELDDGFMEKVKSNLPELPPAIREKLNAIRIEPKVIEDILDRPAMVKPVLEILAKAGGEPARRAVFWLLQSQPISEEPETGPEPELKFDTSRIIELSELVEAGQLSSTAARQVFEALFESAKSPRRLAEELKLLQLSDEAEIDRIVSQVLAENSKVAEEIKAGETKAVGFLVGQVMAKSRGQANPQLAQAIIKKQLGL